MRALGIVLIVVGILALAAPSFTFFTTERAVDTSWLTEVPHEWWTAGKRCKL